MAKKTAREKVLNNIKSALEAHVLPMPFPEADRVPDNNLYNTLDVSLEEQFAEAFNGLGGRFIFCRNLNELSDNIDGLCQTRAWKEVLCAGENLLKQLHQQGLEYIKDAATGTPQADACITLCEALIARTGSAIISSNQTLGRTAPVYYPVHIMVAYASQLVPDLADGFSMLKTKYGDDLPSMVNINTGPSRTADIEKTLVVGVHGPGEVFCFLVEG